MGNLVETKAETRVWIVGGSQVSRGVLRRRVSRVAVIMEVVEP